MQNLLAFDTALMKWIHHHPVPHSIQVLQFISDNTTLFSILLAVFLVGVALVNRTRPTWLNVATLVTALLLSGAVTWTLKNLIDRDRPFTTHPEVVKLSAGGDSSFPSGHTLEAFAVGAVVSALFRRKRYIVPVYLWALTVAYSRVALGVHYPGDILAGMAVGTAVGWMVFHLFNRFRGTP